MYDHYYTSGTVDLVYGSTAVVGTGTAFETALVDGGMFVANGLSVPIASVESETELTLLKPWPGNTLDDQAYSIGLVTAVAASAIESNRRLGEIVARLDAGSFLQPDATGTLAERDAYDGEAQGFIYVQSDVDPFLVYIKQSATSADWSAGQPLRGNPGVGSGGLGLPVGGTTGQVPAKVSAADGDVAWTTPIASAADVLTNPAGSFAGEDVEFVLDDHDGRIVDLEGEVASLAGADIANTPAGSISATTVQAAIDELASEKAATAAIREKLTANRTYYVRADGSDANDGLTDSAAGAFLTIQKAIDAVYALDTSIYNVTIQLRTGTYVGVTLVAPFVGKGDITIQGDAITPANTVVGTTGFTLSGGARLIVKDLKMNTPGESCFYVNAGGVLLWSNIHFGSAHVQVWATNGGYASCLGNYTILADGAGWHIFTDNGGRVECTFKTVTIVGTPNFTGNFVSVGLTATLLFNNNTFSGGATGVRFAVANNGVIYTNGAGATYIPGSVAGVTLSGGIYG